MTHLTRISTRPEKLDAALHRRPSMAAPNGLPACRVCSGSPAKLASCGACYGTGVSTHPADQQPNATTLLATPTELNELLARGFTVYGAYTVESSGGDWRTHSVRLLALVAWPDLDGKGE